LVVKICEVGVELFFVVNGLLYECDKDDMCFVFVMCCVVEVGCIFVYFNFVGG